MPPKTPSDRSWKQAGQEWLFSQGVSTVLLFMILAGLWQSRHYIELLLNAHQNGIATVAKESREAVVQAVNAVADDFAKVHANDQKTIERQEQLIDRLMNRLGQDLAAQGTSGRNNQAASVEP